MPSALEITHEGVTAKEVPPVTGFPYPNMLMRTLLRAPILLYRLGLGELLNLIHIMVLTTRGRSSGMPRHTAIEFRVHGSKIYVVSAWGSRPNWYQNLLAEPRVTLRMGGRSVSARAHMVDDAGEALRVLHLFRKTAPVVYDAVITRLSSQETISLKTLPDISHQFTIVRFEPIADNTTLPGVRGDLRWVWALVLLLSSLLVLRRARSA